MFPVLAIVFAVGWLLFFVGGSRKKVKNGPQKKMVVPKESSDIAEEDPVEVGLMEQLSEEPITRNVC